jgi:hypothetical protein
LTSLSKFISAEQKSSLQFLESSNDQVHPDGNVECRGVDASEEAIGDVSNVVRLNAPSALQGVAHIEIHLHVASRGTGVDNLHNAVMAMY